MDHAIHIDGSECSLRLTLPCELAHSLDRLRDIVNRTIDGFQVLAAACREVMLALQQRFRIQRHRRDGVVDVVGDAAGHLAQCAQALLLHDRLLGLAQVLVGSLQGCVELRVVRCQGDVLGQLAQKLTVVAGEALGLAAARQQDAEHFTFRPAWARRSWRAGRRWRAAGGT